MFLLLFYVNVCIAAFDEALHVSCACERMRQVCIIRPGSCVNGRGWDCACAHVCFCVSVWHASVCVCVCVHVCAHAMLAFM